jgi:hypothetical protein
MSELKENVLNTDKADLIKYVFQYIQGPTILGWSKEYSKVAQM